MNKNTVLHLSLSSLSEEIKLKEISPVEVVRELLARIEEINPVVNAFITVLQEQAVKEARQAEEEIMAGNYRGPLHGIPIGLKDLIYTKGIRTTMGSKIYQNYIPDRDATVVQKLKKAGAIMIGKCNTQEFAYGPTGDASYFGPARNPYNPSKMTGGSSSGSGAAVASGLCFGALGTDTGGSIRIPASATGIVGMKPTFGRISKAGVHPLGRTLDHVGPMTRSIRDNALLLGMLAGFDHEDPFSHNLGNEDFTRCIGESISGKVIGIPTSFYFDRVDEEVKDKVKKAIHVLEDLGAVIRDVEIPVLSKVSYAQLKTLQSEAYAIHEELVLSRPQDYQAQVLERLKQSAEALGFEYVKAQEIRQEAREAFNTVFERIDVIAAPTVAILPPDIGQTEISIEGKTEQVRSALLRLTEPACVTGLPSLSVPCGFSDSGLPIGLQLIGKPFSEARLYQVGAAFEQEAALSTLKWDVPPLVQQS
ncbi:aspartyl-tRNA(Asn)/glutamyl-tRNA(Gln) amidotransferase subunit A [Fictibacillus enclensis]|uniref:Glutamyl-tRNA amidotransferase n=1 Tax=Fictibacillus enclensis TaxID=1017270 RepID=A0A0V8J2N4_9BACL|nr:Asp-tRNA(Asn)/Glu-tRNA(Gln) amidotransferase GatCAB subunit A [Fictibacillus enclensis]KSU81096.1 glutamyl-tRNA amidotransferase [Fictibacillus enclensis]SCC35023.1 aspartyl-tRNA(Asn)/glutamyl-tRNA(Gln) amidotransferase subunit A [Fictibacillus enclensis]